MVARGSRVGVLGNRDYMNTPFSINSYTEKTIEDQQAVTVGDVARNDASVRFVGQTGGILDAFFIRGFPVGEGNAGEIAFDGIYGVAPNYRLFTDYIERVEILKGPAAFLYGMSPASSISVSVLRNCGTDEFVDTASPSATLVAQAGSGRGEPSTPTTHMRQPPYGSSLSS